MPDTFHLRCLCFGLCLATLAACVPDFDTDLSAIREPQLLAIAADPPERQARKPTTLSALVAVPPGTHAASLSWSLCLERKPLTELGPVAPQCLDLQSDAARVELGRGDSVSATLDQDVCRLFGPIRPTQTADEPAGRPVDPDVTGGFYQPVIASLGGVVSLGSIRIDCDPANLNRDDALAFRRQYRENENPRLASLSLRSSASNDDTELPVDGSTLQVKAGSTLSLRAAWSTCPDVSECGDGYCTADEDGSSCKEDCGSEPHGCPGAEHYVWYNRETLRIEPRHEAISVAWYTSSGRFDSEQTGLDEAQVTARTFTDNTWHVGSPSGPALIWVVLRDSRGGQSWETRRVQVTP